MTGLRPLSDTLVTTLIGVTGFYKLSIDDMGKKILDKSIAEIEKFIIK